ncbi:hypothetical protein K1T71_004389 [Dendrolimus kikuchii]|uniref:Uncharacterized protein n=1 Tax=Dendrolimus kikuchii TaxID=765133 RepID=A0ACC1D7A4_9NEOP|nr:hypothetical protein K1T71_004389 [Dendrolimus kikuchii]
MKQYYILIVLYMHNRILEADTVNSNEAVYGNYGLLYTNEGYIYSIPKECSKLLDEFAESASNFTMCSIKHARPISFCEKCVDYYKDFSIKYKNLTTKDINGTSCKAVFISNDRLEVVLEYYNGIMSLWNKGNCNACFDWTKEPTELSNNVKHFNQMYNSTMQCIDHWKPSTNSSEVCEQCMQNYLELNNFYNNMSTDSVGLEGVCVDVVDSMNASRYIWSKTLNCCKLRQSPETVFLVCTGIIASLPLIFYLTVRFCGPIRDLPKVLKQSRFKQTILRSVNARIN